MSEVVISRQSRLEWYFLMIWLGLGSRLGLGLGFVLMICSGPGEG